MESIEGNTSYTAVDLVRWGQDGLAALTSGGHIYLLRGAFVVPQLLAANPAATLTSSSSSTITHGSGNTLLTLTGSNFLPGVAVTWNGSYRTTTIVDGTHVTVAIPASDLVSTGTASLVAINPGGPPSTALQVAIN
jgi:trimeric autotransporter adhesin